VLSIFPGMGLLDRAFEAEGFTVVRGPDPLWGGDVRAFHPPPGRFDGVIGGDPCQSHSSLANLVRAKGLEPSFPDLTGEYQRVIEEARPSWFLRENVPKAPDVKPAGYEVRSFLLDNWASLGEEQMRRRRIWFGVDTEPYGSKWVPCPCCEEFWCQLHLGHASACKCPPVDEPCPELRRWIDFALELGSPSLTVDAGHDKLDPRPGDPKRYSLAEMLELQGLPPTFLDHCPLTMQGKRKAIGNGVPQAMGRALARAIREATDAAARSAGKAKPPE
jgi:DNA (cytosine-5)-methyltransferase 1